MQSCARKTAKNDLRAARRQHHHAGLGAIPMSGGPFPAQPCGQGSQRYPLHHLPVHHEVRYGHPKGPLHQHRVVRWHHHVPRHGRAHDERTDDTRSPHCEDQGGSSPRAQVQRMDWRFYSGLPGHLPADVDFQG